MVLDLITLECYTGESEYGLTAVHTLRVIICCISALITERAASPLVMSASLTDMFRYGTESAMNVSVSEALRTRGDAARSVVNAEMQQMITRKVWTAVRPYSLSPV